MTTPIAQDAGAPIQAHGKRWRLTMAKLAALQNAIPVPREVRPLYSVNDVLRWASSPQALNQALMEACEDGCDEAYLEGLGNVARMALINDLVLEFLGEAGAAASDGDRPSPLEESAASGG